jgi:hypothetical protein
MGAEIGVESPQGPLTEGTPSRRGKGALEKGSQWEQRGSREVASGGSLRRNVESREQRSVYRPTTLGEMASSIETRYPSESVGIGDDLAGSSAHLTRGDLSGSAGDLAARGSC